MTEIKKLKTLIESIVFSNWDKPNWNDEDCELKRTSRDLRIDYSFLKTQCLNNGFITDLTDDLWRICDNTSSYKINTLHDVNDYLIRIERTRNLESIIKGFRDKDKIPVPIIVIKPDSKPYLVGGNTRLMVCKALDIKPKIWLFFLN